MSPQVVLERPQLVGFGTVADLAEAASAGAATVVRLAAKLGFDGFSALQASIQRDLSHQLRPAAERIRELAGDQPIARHRSAELSNVQATLDAVDPATLDAVVDLLADTRHEVLVLAGDAERGVALQFATDLAALRPAWRSVSGSDVTVRRQLALSRGRAPTLARDRPAALRALAARRLRPGQGRRAHDRRPHRRAALAAGDGRPPLLHRSRPASVSPFDSHVGTLALFDLLVATTAERLKESAADRLQRVESAWAEASSLTDP